MTNPFQRVTRIATLLLAGSVLASCAGLTGPRNVELPLTKLQSGIERRFPLNHRLLELFQVELTRPRLDLLADAGRVALSMDALVAPPFLNQSWRGTMTLSGRLVVDAARNAVVMAEPRVDRFNIEGMDEGRQKQLGKVANALMDQVVRDMPVYNFKPEDLRYAGVQFMPAGITVTPRALVVTVEPVK